MVVGDEERANLYRAADEMFLCHNHFVDQFEKELESYAGVRCASFVNSGSSANLLALSALELPKRSEVITCATGFPTTVNSILQCGLVPVFVDCDIPTYNVDVSQLEAAVTRNTRAVILAHALGNPFDIDAVCRFCSDNGLVLIQDCCDALGALYHGKPVQRYSPLSTLSFYPAHHITTGEGGAVLSLTSKLQRIVESYRDWGRDCWCKPGVDNTCGRRFDHVFPNLPNGYDHKYTYSRIGYNLKGTEMQAAIGVAQIKKLPHFLLVRQRNFERLFYGLLDMQDIFLLPEATKYAEPAWFGFPLTVREPYRRADVVQHLESHGIGTRPLFAGNLTRHPAYKDVEYRVACELTNADTVMERTFWVGVYPGITDAMVDYMLEVFHATHR